MARRINIRHHKRRTRHGTISVVGHKRVIEGTSIPLPTKKEILENENYKRGYTDGLNVYKPEDWLGFFENSLKNDRMHYVATEGTISWEVKHKPYLIGKIKGIKKAMALKKVKSTGFVKEGN